MSISVDRKSIESYKGNWDQWFQHKGKTREAKKIFKYLNASEYKIVDDIVVGPIRIEKDITKTYASEVRWRELRSRCDEGSFTTCLNEGNQMKYLR